MFDAFVVNGRQRRATALLAVTALVLLVVSFACPATSARAVEPTVDEQNDRYAYLDMLNEMDLQQILHEKTHGQVRISALRNKEELIAAVRQIEEREDAEASFNERVTAAMQRKAALARQQSGVTVASAKAGNEVSSPSTGRRQSAAPSSNEVNKGRNSKKRVIQLTDEGERGAQGVQSHSRKKGYAAAAAAADGGGAGYAGVKKVSSERRFSAGHELQVLYCTG
ncbi:hypothetical protein LSCM4_01286 [Leishmania orientalis]|uniref:Uncharacterized protein n=1 Tax=Leishmania orientalis TaxID=2249476 RepID=A0A836K7L3_9TRYP|nr:hypothetical protein LSCM4_01286 [Leishmania orientalis]